ncbi:MAG: hypothetical protein ACT4PV_14640 [Planctomycetaceae bacterium]
MKRLLVLLLLAAATLAEDPEAEARARLDAHRAEIPAAGAETPDAGAELAALKARLPVAEAEVEVEVLRKKLEAMAPRKFKHGVKVAFQNDAEFKAYLLVQLDKEFPAEKAEGMQAAWTALGLLPEGLDLRGTLVDALVSQAAAYYDPEQDTFFVVKKIPALMAGPIYLHELQHAIQDQVLGLDTIMKAAVATGNEDRQQAVRFLFEGEATYLMNLYALGAMGRDPKKAAAALEMSLRMMAEMPFETLLQMTEGSAEMMGEEMKEGMAAAQKIPRYILRTLYDAYFRGAYAIHKVMAAKGWEGVDALFANPPASTELLLHPEKLLAEVRDEPKEVALPDLSGALGTRLYESTLGEGSILILLTDQLAEGDQEKGKAAAAGWGGDRFAAYKTDTGRVVLAWLTVWDSEEDAAQFQEAYTTAATARNAAREWPEALIARRGATVVILEGVRGPDGGLMQALLGKGG